MNRKQKLITVTTIFVLLLFFLGMFFFVLYPKLEKIPLKESELTTQEQILSTLQNKITDTNRTAFDSTVTLQKMVPVKPMSEQLLLDIEKAEVVSGSFVENLEFQDGEVAEDSQEPEDLESIATGEDVDSEAEDTKKSDSLPSGLKKITVTINVESPTYFEFEDFIGILENSERITIIESIDFTEKDEEIIEEGQTDMPLRYKVVLAAFYMPTLADLIDRLPKMETPEPADKKNPLSNFGEYSGEEPSKTEVPIQNGNSVEGEQTDEDVTTSTENQNTQSQEYNVQPGDTLTKIAKQFYAEEYKLGILLIQELNQIKGDQIRVGQALKIPSL